MIHAYGAPDPPVPRLLEALIARGHPISTARPGDAGPSRTLVLAGGSRLEPMALGVLLGGRRYAPGARVLVLSRLGAHPDARAQSLRELWDLEEYARATAIPTVTLRLAPLVGPASPFWRKLASGPRLPRAGRDMVQPVAESLVVETLDRLLSGKVAWEGWYELAGTEPMTLAELVELARGSGAGEKGEWEPSLEEISEHRLAETEPWTRHFGLTPKPLREEAASWRA